MYLVEILIPCDVSAELITASTWIFQRDCGKPSSAKKEMLQVFNPQLTEILVQRQEL